MILDFKIEECNSDGTIKKVYIEAKRKGVSKKYWIEKNNYESSTFDKEGNEIECWLLDTSSLSKVGTNGLFVCTLFEDLKQLGSLDVALLIVTMFFGEITMERMVLDIEDALKESKGI